MKQNRGVGRPKKSIDTKLDEILQSVSGRSKKLQQVVENVKDKISWERYFTGAADRIKFLKNVTKRFSDIVKSVLKGEADEKTAIENLKELRKKV